MASTKTMKWIRPNTQNVKALWSRIKHGHFKTTAGTPRFQLVKDIEDPDILYITWSYDKSSLVRCSIDDIPAYLPDERTNDVHRVLRRIARRDLRPPNPTISHTDKAADVVQRCAQSAVQIFQDNLDLSNLEPEVSKTVMELFHETLDEMVVRKLIKGS